MNKSKIEAIEKSLADAQSKVAEIKAQLVEAEKVGDSCSEWLLYSKGEYISTGDGMVCRSPGTLKTSYHLRGRAFSSIEQGKQLDNNQLLYMRIVRAIAAENKKVGYVADFTIGQLNMAFRLRNDRDIASGGWAEIQLQPDHCYMHESVAPKIRGQFTDEELTTFITKGMLL